MNPRLVYLLVAIGAIALSVASVSYANRDSETSTDSSSDDSDGEHGDDGHSLNIQRHQHTQASDSERQSSSQNGHKHDADDNFSDSEDFSDIKVDLAPPSKKFDDEIFDEPNKKFDRLFATAGEPVEPEEALKILLELQAKYARAGESDISEYAKLQIDWRLRSIRDVLEIEAISSRCNEDLGSGRITQEWKSHNKSPGIQPYLRSRRERLFAFCQPMYETRVHKYEGKATYGDINGYARGVAQFLKQSLASVPDEVILKDHFLANKNEKVSAVLSEAYNFRYGGKSFLDRGQKRYKKMFVSFVEQFCGRMPVVEIVPREHLTLALQQDVTQLLSRRVIDWLKVKNICQQILYDPSAAADIVFAYNESQRAKKRAAKQQCKGSGCFAVLGAKTTTPI